MKLRKALEKVVYESNNDYAKTYAKACLELGGSENAEVVENNGVMEIKHEITGEIMQGKELRVQLLYVLSNLGGWRGEIAREVKATLKAFSKQYFNLAFQQKKLKCRDQDIIKKENNQLASLRKSRDSKGFAEN